MNKEIKSKYKKDSHGYTKLPIEEPKEYEPEKYIVREFNDKTETFEYKEVIVNQKLDWETESKLLENLIDMGEE